MADHAIRILSCNLQSGCADRHELTRLIEHHAVDVACCQELTTELARSVRSVLPEALVEHDQTHRGNGIACRRPVSLGRIPMPGRDGFVARLDPSHWPRLSRPVEIINVHISGPHLWPYFPRVLRRRDQVNALLSYVEADGAVARAILGDFNASPAWPVYRVMSRRFSDLAMTASAGQRPDPTWPHWPAAGIRALIRIDHCFGSGLVAHRSEVIEIPGSDHLGLLVDLAPATR